MKERGPLVVLLVVGAVLIAGLVTLFKLRLGQGDLFPAYSSLRADPLGTRALHDALAQVPGLRVERRLKELATLEGTPPRTIVLAGLTTEGWREMTLRDFNALDAAVRGGSRLVIAFRAETAGDAETRAADKKRAAERAKEKKREKKSAELRMKNARADLRQLWGVQVKERLTGARVDRVERWEAERVGEGAWPPSMEWRSEVHFEGEPGVAWRTLYRFSGEPAVMERTLGRGTIVVAGDAFFLSNEAMQRNRSTALLTWIVGPHARVVFDESHLGVVAEPGIAALARRYGLEAAFFTLVLGAGLWVWRRMARFVPPADEVGEVALAYSPAAGLEALLRRAVSPGELAAVCATEWKRAARPGDVARVEAAWAEEPKDAPAVARYNAARRALRRR